MVDRNKVGRGERRRAARAGHVGLCAVGLLIRLLNCDGGRDVVRVDLDSLVCGDALAGGVWRLWDSGLDVRRGGREATLRSTRVVGWRI